MGEPAIDQYDLVFRESKSIGYHVSKELMCSFAEGSSSVSAAILNYVDSNQGIKLLRACADRELATRVTEAVDSILEKTLLRDMPLQFRELSKRSFLEGLTQGVRETTGN